MGMIGDGEEMATEVGFCSGCGIVREDGPDRRPVTECACMVAHHHKDCPRRISVSGPVGIPCDHGLEVCPECDACTCEDLHSVTFKVACEPAVEEEQVP